jgi:hypothetical protein
METAEQLKQEIQQEQTHLAQDEAQLRAISSGPVIYLRHPLTGDIQQVPAVPEKLIPWMGKGYQQFTPVAPDKERI